MRLKIDNKYQEVGFWSFMKCSVLIQLALGGMIYGAMFLLAILIIT